MSGATNICAPLFRPISTSDLAQSRKPMSTEHIDGSSIPCPTDSCTAQWGWERIKADLAANSSVRLNRQNNRSRLLDARHAAIRIGRFSSSSFFRRFWVCSIRFLPEFHCFAFFTLKSRPSRLVQLQRQEWHDQGSQTLSRQRPPVRRQSGEKTSREEKRRV